MNTDSKTEMGKIKDDPKVWLIFIILLPVLLNTIRNPNNDFGTLSAIIREWIAGKTALYSAGSAYFSYAPWAVLVYLPFAYIPHPFGQFIYNFFMLSLLIWSTRYIAKPVTWRTLAIALVTIYTCMFIIQGQYDALVLASLILGWIAYQRKNPWLLGIAIVGLSSKYSYVIIPLIILIAAIRNWPIKKILQAGIIPVIVFASSFFALGWDWPLRYSKLMNLQLQIYTHYEVVSIFSNTLYPASYWQVRPPIGYILIGLTIILSGYVLFKLIRKGINQDALLFTLVLNLVISPYFTFQHGIYLAPIHAKLLKYNQVYGFILFGVAIVDLLFMWIGIGLIIYPLASLVLLVIMLLRGLKKVEPNLTAQVENP